MPDRPRLKIKHTVSVICVTVGIVLFSLAELIPTFILGSIKPLPIGLARHISTAPAQALVYDPEQVCAANLSNDCRISTHEIVLNRHISTSPGTAATPAKAKARVTLDVSEEITDTSTGAPLFSITDSLQLLRNSTYPVVDPVSHMKVEAPGMGVNFETGDFARDGLQYFFPFNSERRSYKFFDSYAQTPYPIDYVRTEHQGESAYFDDSAVYVYQQQLPVVDLSEAALRSYTQPQDISDDPAETPGEEDLTRAQQNRIAKLELQGPASKFYADGGNEAVRLTPFYTANRTIWVESTSGVILNQADDVYFFFAADAAEAHRTARAAGMLKEPDLNATNVHTSDPTLSADPFRTLFRARFEFDQRTQTAQKELAQPVVNTIFRLQLYPYLVKLAAVFLIIFGLWRYTRDLRMIRTRADKA
ncbi:MAG: DUF3068 domain-containing protein [Corynebacterium sp.]|uniref:DUF3068 domain-containing protein n=1 Tax=Corynebacterium sp. TaxID=1720 RepID=UPI0026DB4505|nr:DUF3068 domain-containing protein [Corynebacterium sp.]MDO4761184.1 DUF3068 domain-containing protein [Corynebacterium sp.]